MLKHRLIAGTFLAAAMGGVLVADSYLAPGYPCLLACVLAACGKPEAPVATEAPEPQTIQIGFAWPDLSAFVQVSEAYGVALQVVHDRGRWSARLA